MTKAAPIESQAKGVSFNRSSRKRAQSNRQTTVEITDCRRVGRIRVF